jgi:Tfp pilus assembly protein FimV
LKAHGKSALSIYGGKKMKKTGTVLFMGGVLAAAFVSGHAAALTIGDVEVRSNLGQRLDARIPFMAAAGEDISTQCVKLEDTPNTRFRDVPVMMGYTLSIQKTGDKSWFVVSSNEVVREPVLRFGVVARCGANVSTSREYVIDLRVPDTRRK